MTLPLSLVAGTVATLLAASAAEAVSLRTRQCVQASRATRRVCTEQCTADSRGAYAACFGPGTACASACVARQAACQERPLQVRIDCQGGCNSRLRSALASCRDASDALACADRARLAALECNHGCQLAAAPALQACNRLLRECSRTCPSQPGSPDVIVAHLGDSTCATNYLAPEMRVHSVLNRRLAARYREQRIVSRNLCRSGEFIRELLEERYASVRASEPHIDVALIRYGHNDLALFSPDQFRIYLERLCNRLRTDYPGIHLVLETNTYLDPEHGGSDQANELFNRYWDMSRRVARGRGLPLVDIFERRRDEVQAGNWDLSIRNRRLALERFGQLILDDSKDREMARVEGWFNDVHPNANGVEIAADEEFRTLTTRWPSQLPLAPGGRVATPSQGISIGTRECIESSRLMRKTCLNQCTQDFRGMFVNCFGPGRACTASCVREQAACLAIPAGARLQCQQGCTANLESALASCTSGPCSDAARLEALECSQQCELAVAPMRQACNNGFQDCIRDCAS